MNLAIQLFRAAVIINNFTNTCYSICFYCILYKDSEIDMKLLSEMKQTYLILCLTALLPTILFSQTLGEMSVQTIPEGEGIQYIVRSGNESILIVHSTLPRLSFEANMGIIRVDNPDPGEYRVHLPPGTNIVTFKADGYLPVSERYYIKAKSYAEVRVFPKSQRIVTSDRPELILKYMLTSPNEKIRGSLDGDVLNLDFSEGQVILRPTAGRHTLKLNNSGKIWEDSFDLIDGKTVIAQVIFPEDATEVITEDSPGSLFISSQPPGAKVFMNQVDQGITPLTLENVPTGTYSFNLVRPLYLPEEFSLEVRALEYTTHHVELTSNFGMVTVETEPDGATVFLDGEEKGISPLTLSQLSAGSHRIRIVRSFYYETEDNFEIRSGDDLDKIYKLSPKFGRVSVKSDPAGAEVLVDGQPKGITPVIVEPLMSGSHIITLKLDHYNELVDEVRVSDGDSLEKDYSLKGNFGELSVITDPPGALVIVDHDTLTDILTPVNKMKLEPGEHWISILKKGHDVYDEMVMIALGTLLEIDHVMNRQTGNLKVSSEPQGAKIYLDGGKVGTTPVVLRDVPTGTRVLEIEKSGFDIVEEQVTVQHLQTADVKYTLSSAGTAEWVKKRNRAVLWSAIVPGGGQFSQGKIASGWLYAGVSVGSIFKLLEAQADHKSHLENYESQQQIYRDAKNPSEIFLSYERLLEIHGDLKDAEKKATLHNSIIIAIYSVQLLDSWLFGGGKRPRSSPSDWHSNLGTRGNLSIKGKTVFFGVSINLSGLK